MLAAYSAEIHLMPDWTFFVQLGIFFFAAVVMNSFMFKPMLRLLKKRREYTVDAQERAASIDAAADELERQTAMKLSEAAKEIQDAREDRIAGVYKETLKIISDAKALAKKRKKDTETAIEASKHAIAADIARQVGSIADDVVLKLVH